MTTLMRNGRDRRLGRPAYGPREARTREIGWDPIRGLHQGQRPLRLHRDGASLRAKTGRIHGCTRTLRKTSDSSCTAGAVHTWPLATACLWMADGRYAPESGSLLQCREVTRWAMYGRRPRCKRNLMFCEAFGCSHVYGLFSPGSLPPSRCSRFGCWP